MPYFFFDIDAGSHFRDVSGTALPERAAIGALATKTLVDLASDKPAALRSAPMTIRVRDEAGLPVYQATLTRKAEWIDE